MLELGIKLLISYLLGALNGSLLLGRFVGVDIRSVGSGNAGGTNALRTQGPWFAALVMIIDVGKGFLPVWLLPALVLPYVPIDLEISREWLALACGGAAIIGHCYPVWFNFAGGKGAATAIGTLLAVAPALLLPGLIVFAGVLIFSGMVGLATMTSIASLAPIEWGWHGSTRLPLIVFLFLLSLFIAFTHRSNIQRMLRGEENKMSKVMLFRRARKSAGE